MATTTKKKTSARKKRGKKTPMPSNGTAEKAKPKSTRYLNKEEELAVKLAQAKSENSQLKQALAAKVKEHTETANKLREQLANAELMLLQQGVSKSVDETKLLMEAYDLPENFEFDQDEDGRWRLSYED